MKKNILFLCLLAFTAKAQLPGFSSCNASLDLYNTTVTCPSVTGYAYGRYEFSATGNFSLHNNPANESSIRFSFVTAVSGPAVPLYQAVCLKPGQMYSVRIRYGNSATNWTGSEPVSSVCTFTTDCSIASSSGPVIPKIYWQMDATNSNPSPTAITDIIRTQRLYSPVINTSIVGNALFDNGNYVHTSHSPSQPFPPPPVNTTTKFSFECLVKPNPNNLNYALVINNYSAASNDEIFRFNYDMMRFKANNIVNDPTGYYGTFYFNQYSNGPYNYNYFIDGNWHHLAVVYDASNTSSKHIDYWVDGMKIKTFTGSSIPDSVIFTQSPKLMYYYGGFDEFAIYDDVLTPELITQHYQDMLNGRHYQYCTGYTSSDVAATPAPVCSSLPSNEFPPDLSLKIDEQMNTYPLPRFKPGHQLELNAAIADMNYLALNSGLAGGCYTNTTYGFDSSQAKNVTLQLAQKWNYYLYLSNSNYNYNNSNGCLNPMTSSFIDQANYHPELKTSLHTMWPFTAGSNTTTSTVLNQCFTSYTTYSCNCILTEGNNMASQLSNNSVRYLTRPLDLMLENQEVIGACNYTTLSLPDRGTIMRNIMDRYKSGLLSASNYTNPSVVANTKFRYYQNTGYGNANSSSQCYFPPFSKTYSVNTGSYSTIDTYIAGVINGAQLPSWWAGGPAGSRGMRQYLFGRYSETTYPLNSFANPFVSAGWFQEERNARPAQYLAFLKGLAITGSEMFNASYFNTTPWIDGVGPNDPKGYLYQFAMPSYAQAITSRYEDVFRNGALQQGSAPSTAPYMQVFGNVIAFHRKLAGPKFAVYGALMPDDNCGGLVPDSRNVKLKMNATNEYIDVQIRRQGSTYIYDKTDTSNIVFYQLDKWHENSHPANWTRDFYIEGELYDSLAQGALYTGSKIVTERPVGAAQGDYTDFTSSTLLKPDASAIYHVEARSRNENLTSRNYYLNFRAKKTSGPDVSDDYELSVTVNSAFSEFVVDNTDFKWINCNVQFTLPLDAESEIVIYNNTSTGNVYQIDQIILSEELIDTIPYQETVTCQSARLNITSNPAANTSGQFSAKIVPNPNSGIFSLHFERANFGNCIVNIHSADGRLVYHNPNEKVTGTNANLDLFNVSPGLYFITIIAPDRSSTQIKLVKN